MLFGNQIRIKEQNNAFLITKNNCAAADLILKFNILLKKRRGSMVFSLQRFVEKRVESCTTLL